MKLKKKTLHENVVADMEIEIHSEYFSVQLQRPDSVQIDPTSC